MLIIVWDLYIVNKCGFLTPAEGKKLVFGMLGKEWWW
jgi:hypothetical protein